MRGADLHSILISCDPAGRRTNHHKIAARIDQLTSILRHAPDAGISLTAAEVALIESTAHRLYRERTRVVEVADSLAIRTADAFVARFLERLGERGVLPKETTRRRWS